MITSNAPTPRPAGGDTQDVWVGTVFFRKAVLSNAPEAPKPWAGTVRCLAAEPSDHALQHKPLKEGKMLAGGGMSRISNGFAQARSAVERV